MKTLENIPAGIDPQRFGDAVTAFRDVVGADNVLETPTEHDGFDDPYDAADSRKHRASLVLQPASSEELQRIVAIANRFGIPLWTTSQGRNNGYGGGAPRVSGSVIVNLRRMNRILEVNEKYGYVLLEPGVTFAELHAHLRLHGYKLWTDVPDLCWGSVIGNALEHGIGYTPYGEHADQICGLEVILGNGDLVRTGMGGQPNSRNWQTHPRGFGPRHDQLFMQSNFGIVTKAGLWLMPQPEAWRAVWLHAANEEDVYPLLDALQPLVLNRTIGNRTTVMNMMAQGIALSRKTDWYAGRGALPAEAKKAMAQKLGLGAWAARVGLYGSPEMMDAQFNAIAKAVAHLSGLTIVSRQYAGDAPAQDVHPADQALGGIPSMDLQEMMKWNGHQRPGHVGFAPIAPLSGADGKILMDVLNRHMAELGQDFGAAFALTPRSMQLLALILFDATQPEDVRTTFARTGDMVREVAALGYGEYRGHLEFMDLISAQFSFNDHALGRLNRTLKDALDPNGILAPGKQGIWPSGDRR
ncbi:FAD-binding oxidoreductase [Pseudomonas putida]|uniref:FAD-binding oxidoreductase n=1 Tax=Pseudomonas putida TaxID=303 RepID=A0A4D6XBB8_PSEPU|nr:FAD-binding oxidoreductase [Pseudomonas putida]QCI13104.1 FAD-binding oxidoreductase [Pseudomonas putida]